MGITSPEERTIDRLAALESRFEALIVQDKPGSKSFGAGRIPFGSPTGVLTDSANLVWSESAKKLTLNGGNLTGHNVLTFDTTTADTSPSTVNVAYNPEYILNPGSNNLTVGQFNTLALSAVDGSGGASSSGALVGLRSDARYRQTAGTFGGFIMAIDAVVRHSGAGTLANAYGVRSIGVLSSTGGVTSLYGFVAESPNISSSGAVTTAYGVRINRQKLASGVTTGYGVYQVDPNDQNFFGGLITGDLAIISNQNGLHTRGANSGLVFRDRTSASPDWQWYSSGGGASSLARLYDGTGDVFTVDTSGVVNAVGSYQVNGTRVVTVRQTGWSLPTGTLTRSTFATASVTLPQLAERVAALIDDLFTTNGHGLIGA